MKKSIIKFVFLSVTLMFLGWGSVGHRIINKNTTLSFPSELSFLMFWGDSLSAHGSDADNRKGSDPNEAPKHFIDIDNYAEFVSTGHITQNFDSLVMQHGYTFVIDQGILPWAIIQTVDSLQVAFTQGNWQKAILISADLGHYIGDSYMPLHITKNYNGQYTGQSGIHSRYESNMIGTYQQQIVYSGDSVAYISNVSNFVFDKIYSNYKYVDSVLQYDLTAKSYAGGSYNSTYYQKLWDLTKNFTIKFYKDASYNLASLIYTAWKNAGQPVITKKVELTAMIEGITNGTSMVSDTVTIQLHNVSAPYGLVEQKFVKLNTSGHGIGQFTSASDAVSYYLVVKHRNSIETWSKTPQTFSNDTLKYDFTTAQSKAFGNNLKLKNGKWCIFSGDINQDEFIDGSDVSDCFNASEAGLFGYVVTDITGDDFVDGTDVSIVYNNASAGIGAAYP